MITAIDDTIGKLLRAFGRSPSLEQVRNYTATLDDVTLQAVDQAVVEMIDRMEKLPMPTEVRRWALRIEGRGDGCDSCKGEGRIPVADEEKDESGLRVIGYGCYVQCGCGRPIRGGGKIVDGKDVRNWAFARIIARYCANRAVGHRVCGTRKEWARCWWHSKAEIKQWIELATKVPSMQGLLALEDSLDDESAVGLAEFPLVVVAEVMDKMQWRHKDLLKTA